MESKIIRDGLFEVHEDGTIYRHWKGVRKLCAQVATSRDGKYRAVTYMENGKQKSVYVHRLVAEAFLPNLNNYDQINHIDGVPSNNHVSNLEWCTAKQNVEHAFRTGLTDLMKNAKPCTVCGDLTRAGDQVCPKCRPKVTKEIAHDLKKDEIAQRLSGINLDMLCARNREIVEMRISGMSYESIGEVFAISRQRVEQIIKLVLFRSKTPQREDVGIKREKDKLKKRLMKKQMQLAYLKEQEKDLLSEINDINKILSEFAS